MPDPSKANEGPPLPKQTSGANSGHATGRHCQGATMTTGYLHVEPKSVVQNGKAEDPYAEFRATARMQLGSTVPSEIYIEACVSGLECSQELMRATETAVNLHEQLQKKEALLREFRTKGVFDAKLLEETRALVSKREAELHELRGATVEVSILGRALKEAREQRDNQTGKLGELNELLIANKQREERKDQDMAKMSSMLIERDKRIGELEVAIARRGLLLTGIGALLDSHSESL